jgi:hypothetical protein
MEQSNTIKVFELWRGEPIVQNNYLQTPALDLREISINHRFSLAYRFGGAGTLRFEGFGCATQDGTFIEIGSPTDIVATIAGGGAAKATVNRAVTTNVATIEATSHGLTTGDHALIDGVRDSSYNGLIQVASAPDGNHFTYALTHANEVEVADAGGTVLEIIKGFVGFASSVVNPTPWMKIKATELNAGAIAKLWAWLIVQ